MIRIFDITLKDLLQLTRDFKTFMFLLIMPIAFTLLFGYAFGGFTQEASDPRLPVGYQDEDGSWLSRKLHDVLADSDVIRLDESTLRSAAELEKQIADKKLAAAIIIPAGYGKTALANKTARFTLIVDTTSSSGTTVQAAALAAANRLDSAVSTALTLDEIAGSKIPFDYAFDQALAAWKDPPIAITETTSTAVKHTSDQTASLAHTSPGMMLQFAIAGLMASAQIIVTERKTRALQRLLTTSVHRIHILLGHYLAIFIQTFIQFALLLAFGQFILKIDYLRVPGATLLVAFCAALCIGALGLLIGVVARSEEQATIFSLIPMFVLSGLGGAWVPLEVTGATFQALGHLSPVAWAMDGFKNISLRGLGIESVLIPSAALAGYAIIFLSLAAWRLMVAEEQ
jgi:ABC-type multidrug transport system permease subunit